MQRTCASGVLVLYYCRQRPTLPHSFPCSTIGGSRLNFRVRNGNGCDPAPVTTGILAAWGPASARFASFGGQARDSRFSATAHDWSAEARKAKAEGGSSQAILSK